MKFLSSSFHKELISIVEDVKGNCSNQGLLIITYIFSASYKLRKNAN